VAGQSETVEAFHAFIRSSFGAENVMPEGERSTSQSFGLTPVQHLNAHGLLDRHLLAAHATRVSRADLVLLAEHASSIAHCPRSNARLGNGRAPLPLIKEVGVAVGLGTDGLASCDDLDLRNEARFALGLHRAAEPNFAFGAEEMMKAVTIDSARALSMQSQVGSIEPGKQADLAIFTCDDRQDRQLNSSDANPYRQLVHGRSRLHALLVAGKVVVQNGRLIQVDAGADV
jgi:5-methylthioadenosine/S-adenosylhomocysteine deaminase